jgi:CRISPR/Cas system-associated exonuclease Cas4 (RecB family)
LSDAFYLTPSRITEALSCGLRYYRSYVAKLPRGKDQLSRFCGDMQHQSLDRWGKGAEDHLLKLWELLWLENAPDGFKPILQAYLNLHAKQLVLAQHLEGVVAEIRAARPEIKQPTATKEYKEAAAASGGAQINEAFDRLRAKELAWYRSDDCPWEAKKMPPTVVFSEGGAALQQFLSWWDQLAAEGRQPQILHTEVKQRDILLGGGAFTLTGVIDAVYLWPDGMTEVVDYKRGRPSDGELNHFPASATYALTCEQILGFLPDRVTFHYLREGDRSSYEVRPGWSDHLLKLCERVKRMHEFEEWNPSFRTCSWCDFRKLCEDQFGFAPIDFAPIEEAA